LTDVWRQDATVLDFVEHMMGCLFYQKQPISEIISLSYPDLKTWYKWHKGFLEAKTEAYNKLFGD
jgi:hypothetical protein